MGAGQIIAQSNLFIKKNLKLVLNKYVCAM